MKLIPYTTVLFYCCTSKKKIYPVSYHTINTAVCYEYCYTINTDPARLAPAKRKTIAKQDGTHYCKIRVSGLEYWYYCCCMLLLQLPQYIFEINYTTYSLYHTRSMTYLYTGGGSQ